MYCLFAAHLWHKHNIRMDDDHRVYHKCDLCSFETPSSIRIRNHISAHGNIRNFSCEHCGDRFRTSNTLRTHIKWKHTTEEKACDQCDFKTKTMSSLNNHILIQHQLKGIKPYHCPYCDFTCASGGNCRKHIMGRHKGKPVKYECDKTFREIAKVARSLGNNKPLVDQV